MGESGDPFVDGLLAYRMIFERWEHPITLFRVEDPARPLALRLVAANPAAARALRTGGRLGTTIDAAYPELHGSELPARYLQAALRGVSDEWEMYSPGDHLPRGYWRVQALPLDPAHVVVVFHDVTRQRVAEETLQQRGEELEQANARLEELARRVAATLDASETRFRTVLDQVPAVVWTLDRELVVESVIGSGVSREGMATVFIHGAKLDSLIEHGSEMLERSRRALRGEPCAFVAHFRDRIYDTHLRPLRAPSGEIVGVIGAAIDVTERTELELRLQQRQRLESIGRLAGGIAHDFNNLLTIILHSAELLLSGSADQGDVRQIVDAAERGERLTGQLLAFARQQVIRPRRLDFGDLAVRTGAMLERLIGEDIELVVDVPSDPLMVEADLGQMEQVLMNLAVNARDAMPSGGRLRIRCSRRELGSEHPGLPGGAYVELRVEDDGVGMDDATRARAFEPFFTTKASGNSGLGLSTVYGIVEQSRGAVRLASTLGRGTTVTVLLPLMEACVGENAGMHPRSEEHVVARSTVLVVDDNKSIASLTARSLRDAGFNVLEATTTSAAIETATRHHDAIDVLLVDVVMAGMSGPELASRLRALQPAVRVVYMSGYPGDRLSQTADARFLPKPFSPSQLVSAVRGALPGSAPERDESALP